MFENMLISWGKVDNYKGIPVAMCAGYIGGQNDKFNKNYTTIIYRNAGIFND